MEGLLILFIILLISIFVGTFIWSKKKRQEIDDKIESLASGVEELTPEQFFELRNFSFGGRGKPKYALNKNFAGVYIIYNKSKNMYYVGQAHRILDRVNSHFTGKGNGNVYADYKYGDSFTIRMISLESSGYQSLNDLERDTIRKFDSFAKGYNKTRGNR